MNTFDGSTTDAPPTSNGAAVEPDDDYTGISALEQLREVVEHREDAEPWPYVVPKRDVRLTFDTDVPSHEYQRWMRASMPRGKRRGTPDFTQLDQYTLTSRAIRNCCTTVEVRNRKVKAESDPGAWIVVTGKEGTPLRLDDDELLRAFKTPDSGTLVAKLIGREADVITAGMELLAECGYAPGDDDEDESDPT